MAKQPKTPAKAAPNKIGPPSLYTDELAEKICEQVALGDTLNTLDKDPAFPSRRTIQNWLAANEGFRGKYEQAREHRAERYVEQLRDVLTDLREKRMEANEARTAFNILSWLASNDNPKRYSDRITHTDADGGKLSITIMRFTDGPEPIDITPEPMKALANGQYHPAGE